MLSRKVLFFALCTALGMFGWNTISAQETVMLHIPAEHEDYYATLWVVEAKPYLWIRAETPTRSWLEPLRENPNVYLWRGEVRRRYHAVIWENRGGDAHAYVSALFREKYGWFDYARSLLRTTPTTLIRLEPLSG
jgi:hypothetical protein